jgi:hypothetical protein
VNIRMFTRRISISKPEISTSSKAKPTENDD